MTSEVDDIASGSFSVARVTMARGEAALARTALLGTPESEAQDHNVWLGDIIPTESLLKDRPQNSVISQRGLRGT